MSSSRYLEGVYAPVVTPFTADRNPDVERWIAFCKHLLAAGCHGLCPFGTTGEANSLGIDERMEMLDRLVASGLSPSLLMPGTGMCAIPDTVALTAQAVELGCAGVLLLPPFYYKGVRDDGLFAGIAEVIERVGDDRLHVYLYHIPPIAQVGFSIKLVERLITRYPDTVVGLKDSSRDWNNLHALLTNFPDFNTFAGTELFLLKTMRFGGAGTISAMANLIPGQLRHLYDHWQADNADELQAAANGMGSVIASDAPIPDIKAIIADQFGDLAWRTVRPPCVALGDDDATELLNRVRALGSTSPTA
jgi:4-hydroxy-tetrahydrodipicolinate synthase